MHADVLNFRSSGKEAGVTKWRVATAGFVLVIGLGGSVLADTTVIDDPQEAIYTPIDAQQASHGHAAQSEFAGGGALGASVLVHDVTMYDAWSNHQLRSFELRLRSRQWRVPRRVFVASNDDGTFYGTIWSRDRLRGYARVHRPDERTLRILFPKGALGEDVRRYRWVAVMTGPWECPEGAECAPPPVERVPDTGTVLHRGIWRFNE